MKSSSIPCQDGLAADRSHATICGSSPVVNAGSRKLNLRPYHSSRSHELKFDEVAVLATAWTVNTKYLHEDVNQAFLGTSFGLRQFRLHPRPIGRVTPSQHAS